VRFLAGTLLGGPVLGLVAGVTAGVLKGKRKDRDYGLNADFVSGVSRGVRPNRSAIFLLVKQADAEQLQVKLRPMPATVLSTTLEPEQEQRLRRALAEEEYGS
jgi:uncharacterized membrane protein